MKENLVELPAGWETWSGPKFQTEEGGPFSPEKIANDLLDDLKVSYGVAWNKFVPAPLTLAEAQLPISQWRGLALLGVWLIGAGQVTLNDELAQRIIRGLFVFDDADLYSLRHFEKDADAVRQAQGQSRYLYAGAKALHPHIDAFFASEDRAALRKRYPLAETAQGNLAQMEILRSIKF